MNFCNEDNTNNKDIFLLTEKYINKIDHNQQLEYQIQKLQITIRTLQDENLQLKTHNLNHIYHIYELKNKIDRLDTKIFDLLHNHY